jgi:PAS domain S-box-containing protein
MIFKLDPQGNFYFTSAEFGRALGYKDGALIGQHFSTIVHPDYLVGCNEAFGMLIEFGKAEENLNFQVKHVNGNYKWVNCSATCLFVNGRPSHIIGFAHEITELVRTHELLALENKRYIEATKAVAQAVVDAQEKERAEIGYELHDNVNQILSTARLYLDLAKNNETDRITLITKSAEGIANAVSEIRKISRSLVPASIGDLGLVPSIEDLVESLKSIKTLKVEFHYEGEIEATVTDKRKLMLFRIIQEQVTNVLKHAEASLLFIELIVDKSFINLSISDNGKGFDKEAVKIKKGVGLHNIANRAELFNGTVKLVTSSGKGCKLKIVIPVDNQP